MIYTADRETRKRIIKKSLSTICLSLLIIIGIISLWNTEGVAGMRDKSAYKTRLKEINITDGVDGKEAIIIAQNYLIGERLDKNCIIFWPKAKDSFLYDNAWTVNFPPSIKVIFNTPFAFQVHIDKKTGKVISAGWNK